MPCLSPKKRTAGTIVRKSEQTFTDLAFCSCGGTTRLPPNNPRYTCPNCHSRISIDDLENYFAQDLTTFLLEDSDTPMDDVADLPERWLELEPPVRRDIALTYLDSLTVDKQGIQFVYQFPSSLKEATSVPHTVDPTDINSTDSQGRPKYIRHPKAGTQCSYSDSAAQLNQLILPSEDNDHDPPVKSVAITQPGKKRGVRMVLLSSLLEYLEQR
ncbi:MAG: hypothetical protein R3F19_25135 [Verrucomicrobiales bacterium]